MADLVVWQSNLHQHQPDIEVPYGWWILKGRDVSIKLVMNYSINVSRLTKIWPPLFLSVGYGVSPHLLLHPTSRIDLDVW